MPGVRSPPSFGTRHIREQQEPAHSRNRRAQAPQQQARTGVHFMFYRISESLPQHWNPAWPHAIHHDFVTLETQAAQTVLDHVVSTEIAPTTSHCKHSDSLGPIITCGHPLPPPIPRWFVDLGAAISLFGRAGVGGVPQRTFFVTSAPPLLAKRCLGAY